MQDHSVMTALDELTITTLRTLCIDSVERANSGHPGLPMGAAPMAYTLWHSFLRHNPKILHSSTGIALSYLQAMALPSCIVFSIYLDTIYPLMI